MLSKRSALERLLRPLEQSMPAEFARQLLAMEFGRDDQLRYESLSAGAQNGTLTPHEQIELDDLLMANDVIAILRAKARISLGRASSSARK